MAQDADALPPDLSETALTQALEDRFHQEIVEAALGIVGQYLDRVEVARSEAEARHAALEEQVRQTLAAATADQDGEAESRPESSDPSLTAQVAALQQELEAAGRMLAESEAHAEARLAALEQERAETAKALGANEARAAAQTQALRQELEAAGRMLAESEASAGARITALQQECEDAAKALAAGEARAAAQAQAMRQEREDAAKALATSEEHAAAQGRRAEETQSRLQEALVELAALRQQASSRSPASEPQAVGPDAELVASLRAQNAKLQAQLAKFQEIWERVNG
ncbi:hypothetical protein [Solidesulfovibrio magneticus]|nr:hypothetical protein [Solidesulfovibrio magneticus]